MVTKSDPTRLERLSWGLGDPERGFEYAERKPGILPNDVFWCALTLTLVAFLPHVIRTLWTIFDGDMSGFAAGLSPLANFVAYPMIGILLCTFLCAATMRKSEWHMTFGWWLDVISFCSLTFWVGATAERIAFSWGAGVGVGKTLWWGGLFLSVVLIGKAVLYWKKTSQELNQGDTRRFGTKGFFGTIVVTLFLAHVVFVATNLSRIRPMLEGEPMPEVWVGRIASDGTIGKRVELSSLDKPTVVIFWATWCSPCKRALKEVLRLSRSDPSFSVALVNLDDPKKSLEYTAGAGPMVEEYSDTFGAADELGVSTIPHTLIVGESGDVKTIHRGGFSSNWLETQLQD